MACRHNNPDFVVPSRLLPGQNISPQGNYRYTTVCGRGTAGTRARVVLAHGSRHAGLGDYQLPDAPYYQPRPPAATSIFPKPSKSATMRLSRSGTSSRAYHCRRPYSRRDRRRLVLALVLAASFVI